MAAFDWTSTCPYILSMPNSETERASVLEQLRQAGIRRPRVYPGMMLTDPETVEVEVRAAAAECLVPPSYVADSQASSRWRGTVGSSLAHLKLLRNASADVSCSWIMVIADDVVLLPGFKEWIAKNVMRSLGAADFVNLAVVRGWGKPVDGSVATRVSGELTWRSWAAGGSPAGIVRYPNLLVSGYLARREALPRLLASFAGTDGWTRPCSIDQVLSRVQYAMASAGRLNAFNVDADKSLLAHCAVGPNEVADWSQHHPSRHVACQYAHPHIYGQGSRSHDRRLAEKRPLDAPPSRDTLPLRGALELPSARLKAAQLKAALQAGGCFHGFRVPADRVVVDEGGKLTTIAMRDWLVRHAYAYSGGHPYKGRNGSVSHGLGIGHASHDGSLLSIAHLSQMFPDQPQAC